MVVGLLTLTEGTSMRTTRGESGRRCVLSRGGGERFHNACRIASATMDTSMKLMHPLLPWGALELSGESREVKKEQSLLPGKLARCWRVAPEETKRSRGTASTTTACLCFVLGLCSSRLRANIFDRHFCRVAGYQVTQLADQAI